MSNYFHGRRPAIVNRRAWVCPPKLHRLKENVGAAAVALTADDLRRIDEALALIQVQGDRYPAPLAARVGK